MISVVDVTLQLASASNTIGSQAEGRDVQDWPEHD